MDVLWCAIGIVCLFETSLSVRDKTKIFTDKL